MNNPTISTFNLLEQNLMAITRISDSLSAFWEEMETNKNANEGDELDKQMAAIAKSLNPDLSDEEADGIAEIPIITLANIAISNQASYMLVALKLAKGKQDWEDTSAVDSLLRSAGKAQRSKPDVDEVIKNMPWFLKTALSFITSTDAYKNEPVSSHMMVGARIISVILHSLEGDDRFVWEPPEDGPGLEELLH